MVRAQGAVEEFLGVVGGDDVDAFAGEGAGIVSVAAGDVEDGLAGFGGEEAIGGGHDEGFLEVISFGELLVPPWGDAIPEVAGLLDGGWGHGVRVPEDRTGRKNMRVRRGVRRRANCVLRSFPRHRNLRGLPRNLQHTRRRRSDSSVLGGHPR